MSQENEKTHLKKDFDDLYEYLKNVINLNKVLSSTFMVISLTGFIFLISMGYPDILDEQIVIGNTTIKVVSLSLSLLVLSFFSFLTSTLIYHYKGLKVNSLYLYGDSKLNFIERYKKTEKLAESIIEGLLLFMGILALSAAVIFMFFYFSAIGIIISTIMFLIYGLIVLALYLSTKLNKYIQKKT